MITEWWYESAIFDFDGDVVLARLTQHDDGTAEILTDDGGTRSFASREDATCWFADEENYPLADLDVILAEQNLGLSPRITPPSATCLADLVNQMVIPKLLKGSLPQGRSSALATPRATGILI